MGKIPVKHVFYKTYWFESKDTLACQWIDMKDALAWKGLKGCISSII